MSREVTTRIERIENRIVQETYRARHDLPPVPLVDLLEQLGVPGVSVAVIEGGEIAWARGYGVREAGRSEAVTPETMFQAGSISKPVAVMGALRLVQEGILNLDEDANAYLKSWRVPANDGWQPRVTLRQLMCHGAGTTVHGFPGYNRRAPVPTVPQVLDGLPPANTPSVRVSAIPGTQFRYSGGGTTIIQQVMTDVTGQPFPDLMRQLVLGALNMEHSTYEQPLPQRWWHRAATGHRTAAIPVDGKWHVYPEMAAAGLWTTPSDLAGAAIDVQRAWAGEPNTLLRHDMVREMLRPQVERHIGLGFFLSGERDTLRFRHDGSDEGFLCGLVAYGESGNGAAVMTNGDAGSQLIGDVLLTIAREYGWPDYPLPQRETLRVDPDQETDFVGEYDLNTGFRFTVGHADGRLFLQPTGQEKMPLYSFSETGFFARAVKAELVFTRDHDGQVTGLQFLQNDREIPGKKVG